MGELETQTEMTRAEVAEHLRALADQFDGGDEMTLDLDGQAVTLTPTEPLTVKMEAESDWSEGDTVAKQSVEFEFVWRREATTAEEAGTDQFATGQ